MGSRDSLLRPGPSTSREELVVSTRGCANGLCGTRGGARPAGDTSPAREPTETVAPLRFGDSHAQV